MTASLMVVVKHSEGHIAEQPCFIVLLPPQSGRVTPRYHAQHEAKSEVEYISYMGMYDIEDKILVYI